MHAGCSGRTASRSRQSFSGSRAADFLLERTGLHIAGDDRQEQVLAVDPRDFLLGDIAPADQGRLGQGAGPGLADGVLDLLELLGLEPVASFSASSSRIKGWVRDASWYELTMGRSRVTSWD